MWLMKTTAVQSLTNIATTSALALFYPGLINLVSVPADDARQVTLAMRGGGTSGAQTPDLAVDSLENSINQFTFTVFGLID